MGNDTPPDGSTSNPRRCIWKQGINRCHEVVESSATWSEDRTRPFVCKRHEPSVARFLARSIHEDELAALEDELRVAREQWHALQEILSKENSVVYYLERSDGLIKIGVSRALMSRISALESEHNQHLRLRATEYGGSVTERTRHRQFSHLRRTGEWFEPAEELVSHCDWIASQSPSFRPTPTSLAG